MRSSFRRSGKKAFLALFLGFVLASGFIIQGTPAEARTRVGVGIGFGIPLWGPGYYDPYYGGAYHGWPYYGYPPAYYAPPPVVYAPPPVAYYSPAPAAQSAPPQQECREYRSAGMVGGRSEWVYGTACRQADGSWQIVD